MKSLASMAIVLMIGATVAADPPDADASAAYAKLQAKWDLGESEYARELDLAATAERRNAAFTKAPSQADFAARFLKLGEIYPGTKAELNALIWAALNAPRERIGTAGAVAIAVDRPNRAAHSRRVPGRGRLARNAR